MPVHVRTRASAARKVRLRIDLTTITQPPDARPVQRNASFIINRYLSIIWMSEANAYSAMELDIPFSDPEPVIEEVEEPSVLEYAREQGICIDYTTDLPRLVDICLSLKDIVDQNSCDPFDDDLTNAVTAAHELTKQRLAVTKDVASLLKSVLGLREPPAADPLATDVQQRIRDMKQELPILQTDAELDMLRFGTRVEPDFRDLRTQLPSEDLDEENDEGFGWPTKYSAYPAQCDAKIRSEKLVVTRDVLTVLQSAMTDDFTPEDDEKIMTEALESRRVGMFLALNINADTFRIWYLDI